MSAEQPLDMVYSMEDIASMSDDELGQIMMKHRLHNGEIHLPFSGWQNLPKDEREQFAERLLAVQKAITISSGNSAPLDLDLLNKRLQGALLNAEMRERRRSTSPTVPFDEERFLREIETAAYHYLIAENGRPVYSIDRMEEVLGNAQKYTDIFQPWQSKEWIDDHRIVFQWQWRRWKDFRAWQHEYRGIEQDENAVRERFIQEEIDARTIVRHGNWSLKLPEDSAMLDRAWARELRLNDDRRIWRREAYYSRFPKYTAAAKQRLMRHNFTRPFQLSKQLLQQDQLTTWIEYINFECWFLDEWEASTKRLKIWRDKTWKKLQDMDILKPDETEEYVRSEEAEIIFYSEQDKAEKVVRNAQRRVDYLATTFPGKRLEDANQASQWLKKTQNKLHRIIERNQALSEFYSRAKRHETKQEDVARQRRVVEWAIKQIPVVEAEMAELQSHTSVSKPSSTKQTRRGTKRKSTDAKPLTEETQLTKPVSKKSRL